LDEQKYRGTTQKQIVNLRWSPRFSTCFNITQNVMGNEKMKATLLFGVLLQLSLFTAVTDAFCSPHQLRRSPGIRHHNGFAVEALMSTKRDHAAGSNMKQRPKNPQPAARLTGYIATAERDNLERALRAVGFLVLDDDDDDAHAAATAARDIDCFSYRWNAATGMLQLLRQQNTSTKSPSSSPTATIEPPTWIPVVLGEENLLAANGWSFLDVDDSEQLSPFDVDAANQEGLYRPKWGCEPGNANQVQLWSSLGFDLTPPAPAQILEEAASLQNELSRHVLLEGGTDPAGVKQTHNKYSFSGSVQKGKIESGIFSCAVGGLPLFATTDISPTTASSGWLSFAQPLSADHVTHIEPAQDADDRRVEVVCAKTGCHLGHYFGRADGYCINASALNFCSAASREGAAASDSDDDNDTGPNLFAAPVSYRRLETAEQTPSIRLLREVISVNSVGRTSKVVLAAGCFWHVEFALRRLVGVVSTVAGYAGGTTQRPTYESVCNGETGHCEAVQVEFDTAVLEPRVLMDCFLAMHDPTKVRAHGKHASGTGQYRSGIFLPSLTVTTASGTEAIVRQALQDCKSQLEKELSTECRVMGSDGSDWFWSAEERHQRHDERRGECTVDDLSTLSASDWLQKYGRRSESIVGSSQTINSAVIET
jgi:peptide-methionine (S)-S-oxide reductase